MAAAACEAVFGHRLWFAQSDTGQRAWEHAIYGAVAHQVFEASDGLREHDEAGMTLLRQSKNFDADAVCYHRFNIGAAACSGSAASRRNSCIAAESDPVASLWRSISVIGPHVQEDQLTPLADAIEQASAALGREVSRRVVA